MATANRNYLFIVDLTRFSTALKKADGERIPNYFPTTAAKILSRYHILSAVSGSANRKRIQPGLF